MRDNEVDKGKEYQSLVEKGYFNHSTYATEPLIDVDSPVFFSPFEFVELVLMQKLIERNQIRPQ